MDPAKNPYTPGAGLMPAVVAGRQAEHELFDQVISRLLANRATRSIALYGLRGVGKTVLLGEFAARARARGIAIARDELREGQGRQPLDVRLADMLAELLDGIRGTGPLRGLLKRASERVESFSVSFGPLSVSAKRRADTRLDRELFAVLRDVAHAALDAETALVLCLDEAQFADTEHMGALLTAVHRLGQDQLPVVLVVAGLPDLPESLSEANTYAERLFEFREIGALDDEAALRAIVEPAEGEGVSYEGDAAERLAAATAGYPYFLQLHGKYAWDVATTAPISSANVATAIDLARGDLDRGFFLSRYRKATNRQQDYLCAMARVAGDEAASTGAIAEEMGIDRNAASPFRDALLKAGLVYQPRRGQVAFSAPLFGDYLRRTQLDTAGE